MSELQYILTIRDLWKSFNGKNILKGINLEIISGDTLAIVGRSGCGKSVLLKIIVGLIEADAGDIFFRGKLISKLRRRKDLNLIRHQIGFLFQSAALFDFMTVEENVGFMLNQHSKLKKHQIRQIVAETLEMVGLSGTQKLKPAELSGGMKKRIGLARAIVTEPELILYDEPTSGLDPITTAEINQLISNLNKKLNATSIVITHDVNSACAMATNIAMMHEGKIIAHGPPEEICQSNDPRVSTFMECR